MFGKKDKSSKGKSSKKILGLFKASGKKGSLNGDESRPGFEPNFNPMEVAAFQERIEQASPDTWDGSPDQLESAVLGALEDVAQDMAVTEPEVLDFSDVVDDDMPTFVKENEEVRDLSTRQEDELASAIEDLRVPYLANPPHDDHRVDTQQVADEAPDLEVEPEIDELGTVADTTMPAEIGAATVQSPEVNAKVAVHSLFNISLDPEPQGIALEKSPVEIIPELKSIFRSDGQMVKAGRLGRFVHERGLVSGDALDAGYREQEVTGRPIGHILVKNGFLTDKQRVQAILAVEESRISQEQVSRSRVPVALLDQHSIIISAEHDETIFVASPHSEYEISRIIEEYYPEKKIEFVAYDPSSMNRFITTMRRASSVEDIRETKETMLDRIVYKALETNASDVHITPQADCYAVQFRIDGVKRIIRIGALEEYNTVMAQVKDRATIDLAEKRKSQDGSYQVEYNGKMIDLRVSTLPVQAGEHVTIRVLDSDRVHPNLDTLGISQVHKWRRGFKQRDGICIIAGATGSGKTTTLSSSLREIDRFGKAIFSIEDPVEYRIPFVGQVSTNPSVGLDFAAAIKAFMRNDPDVIILGEVRDSDTARNAIKAADTGHLVLITLHTSSIMSTISRMKDLGVEPRELRYMLRSILVQHLIPKLCTTCHGKDQFCRTCKGERYIGRTVASECEYFESVRDVDKLLEARNEHLSDDLRTWTPMAEDAVNQMRRGITDVPGLERTFGSQIYPFLNEEEKLLCSNL